MPKFSVIIPLYNKEKHILETLNSVLNQKFTDYEIILVNDGSTDNSFNEVLKIKHETLFIFDRKNKGVSEARNFAMQQAKGDYLAFLDADDIWKNNHLQNLNNLIISFPNCGLYCANYIFDYGNNFIVNTHFPTLPKNKYWKGIVHDFFLASLKHRIAWTSAVAIPKSIISTVGYFDKNLTAAEDIDFWTRIALKYPIAFTKEITAIYKIFASNRISNISPIKHKYATFEKFREEEKNNLSLKKFNDLYRVEIAIKYKLAGNIETYNFYKKDIQVKNLNWKKRILLILPKFILSPMWKFKQWLKTKKIDFYS